MAKPPEKPLLPARMSVMRLSRLAVCTLASDTPMTKIEVSCSGEIRSMSSQRSIRASLLRKSINSDARGSPIALSSASPHCDRIGRAAEEAGKFCKRALLSFQNNDIRQIGNVEDYRGTGRKEVVFHLLNVPPTPPLAVRNAI